MKIEFSCVISVVSGDSGGPLLQPFAPGGDTSAGQPSLDIILGITSFGDSISKCGMSELPSVFTEVGSFFDWIHDIIDVRLCLFKGYQY